MAINEGKSPLCDVHHRKMLPHVCTELRADVYKCSVADCSRFYASRYGYFNLISGDSPVAGVMDPESRHMKACSTKQHAHSYMAITRPKSNGPGTKALWRWHCYACR